VVTINAEYPRSGMTIVERAAKNVDRADVERMQQEEAARRTAKRIAVLRHIVFRNAARGRRDIEDLAGEPDAARLLIRAHNVADGFAILAIVRVAIDKRWHSVVQVGIRYFGEHPVATRIQELWNLTTGRSAV
jgi:hypothetical protein